VRTEHSDFEIDDEPSRIDFGAVHSWLTGAYWSPGVTREKVERAAGGSASVIGAYVDGKQVGYARVVSDKETFAWLCDVFVDEAFRGKGIARGMVRFALNLPYADGMRRWVLATKDAHGIYADCGFQVLDNPDRWMILRNRRSG
jgi:GNAT superfamily N-acetyltransferase